MMGRKKKKEYEYRSGKLQIVKQKTLASSTNSFPTIEIVGDPMSMTADEIERVGKQLMQYLSENCSGTFVKGMRKYMLENQITITYGDKDLE